MKRILTLLLALVMVFALAACGSSAAPAPAPAATEAPAAPAEPAPVEEPVELRVFAAASMTESLTKVEEVYEAENPGVDLVFTLDSSGTLRDQIKEGAECDVFISAGQKQMDALDVSANEEKNPDKLDFVQQGSRINLLENKIVLVVPEGNPKNIESFDQLAQLLKDGDVFLGMGDSSVPVGGYTIDILEKYYELSVDDLANAGLTTAASNVKEVVKQVKEASVDCGVVYATDAAPAGLEVVDMATAEMLAPAVYPAAVMKDSANPEAAQAFLDYIAGGEGRDILASFGFTMLG